MKSKTPEKSVSFINKRDVNPSTLLNPVPVVMVSCGNAQRSNIITVAWSGTVNSEPPMLSVSIRKSRYSHEIISESGLFTVNLVNRDLTKAADFCGVKSGRDVDKFSEMKLTKHISETTGVPMVGESPVNIECRVNKVLELGSHDLFIADILSVHVAECLFDENGSIDLGKAGLVAYSHGEYYSLGNILGFFGYSVASKDVLRRRLRK